MIGAALALLAAACGVPVDLPAGTPITVATLAPLSSKAAAVGDRVELRVVQDIRRDGVLAVPRGSLAVAEIADARRKGVMGMTGRLTLRLLYLTVGDATVRLTGDIAAKGSVPFGTVAGLTMLNVFTGRSAVLPAGTALTAFVARPVRVTAPCPSG